MAFCQQCGSPVGDGDAFCGNCGAKLSEAAIAAEAQQPAQTEIDGKAADDSAADPQTQDETQAPASDSSPKDGESSEIEGASDVAKQDEAGESSEQGRNEDAAGAPSAEASAAPQAEPAAASVAPAAMPDFNSATAYANQQATPPQSPYGQQSYGQPYGQGQQQPYGQQPYAAPYAQPEKGPLGKAWADFVAAPKKFFTLLKLALAMFLPGANEIILSGYSCHWAKDAALGRKSTMPEKLIRPGVLDSGLYSYLVSFLFGLVFVVVFFIIAALFDAVHMPDAITVIVFLALLVLYAPTSAVMQMRAVICSRVRDGFNAGKVCDELFNSKKLGKIAIAVFVPAIIAGFIAILLVCLFVALFGLAGALGSMSHYGMSPYYSLWILGGLGFFGVLVLLLFLYAIFFVFAASEIVSMRAMGYIFEEFQPQNWKEYQENSAAYAKDVI